MELPWEDNLLERKTGGDLKDLPKTMVAFANSVMPDHIATILIGEKDDGTAQGVQNPDEIQKKIRKWADQIYPPIQWRSRVYEVDSVSCVRIEIEYSGNTPHFSGKAYVRKGSVTEEASEEIFQKLIALRSSKVRELSKWLGKKVTVSFDYPSVGAPYHVWSSSPLMHGVRWGPKAYVNISDVNEFYVKLEKNREEGIVSEPLDKITLTYDNEADQLELIIRA